MIDKDDFDYCEVCERIVPEGEEHDAHKHLAVQSSNGYRVASGGSP